MSKVSLLRREYNVAMSIIKMEQIASHLVGLLRHSNISRAELALQLGWKKSRVTKVLSGDENLTIKTITAIAEQLGYDFDIVFHNKNYEKPKQPWQIDREKFTTHLATVQQVVVDRNIIFELETSSKVIEDVLAGNEKELYISITSPSSVPNIIDISSSIPQISMREPTLVEFTIKSDTKVVCYE